METYDSRLSNAFIYKTANDALAAKVPLNDAVNEILTFFKGPAPTSVKRRATKAMFELKQEITAESLFDFRYLKTS